MAESILYVFGFLLYTFAVFIVGANNRWTKKKIERKADELLRKHLGIGA